LLLILHYSLQTHNNNNPRFGHMAGKSNLFFVFLCRPLSSKIEIQESEIAAAQWMAVDEYMKNVEKRYIQKDPFYEFLK